MIVLHGHYVGACVQVSFMDILWGVSRKRMLCRCCYDMEMYELVGRLYTLLQQGHGLDMLQMGWSSMDLNMGIGQILDESKM